MGLPQGCKDPRTWVVFRCFPRHISRKLDREVEQLGLELGLKSAPIEDAGVTGSGLTCYTKAAAPLAFK